MLDGYRPICKEFGRDRVADLPAHTHKQWYATTRSGAAQFRAAAGSEHVSRFLSVCQGIYIGLVAGHLGDRLWFP